jgi:hypothetical protein
MNLIITTIIIIMQLQEFLAVDETSEFVRSLKALHPRGGNAHETYLSKKMREKKIRSEASVRVYLIRFETFVYR